MQLMTNNNTNYQISQVVVLSFINLQPTNMDVIYSALMFSSKECERNKQKTCLVTLDQPLYAKAFDIVAACRNSGKLSSIVVRLGGFHILMSFMGAVAYIMKDSGIEELWSCVYASNSIPHVMSGHSHALRAHFFNTVSNCKMYI